MNSAHCSKNVAGTPGKSVAKSVGENNGRVLEKDLYLLLPFYLFQEESKFDEIEKDDTKIQALKDLVHTILARLDQAVADGKLTSYEREALEWMLAKVAENLTDNYKKISKGVEEAMGGEVLELPFEKYWEDGKKATSIDVAKKMLIDNELSRDKIILYSGLSNEELDELESELEGELERI